MKNIFKYYPESFGKLNVKIIHMDLDFDVFEEHTVALSKTSLVALDDLNEICLDAKNLEVLEVSCDKAKTTYEYEKENDKLKIFLETKIKKGTEFSITTKTVCRPTKNILEGIYYDETPKGCPKTQITQCQQWGFQRLVPCFDDMTAKATYKTAITADSRYTNILTNGDVSVKRHPAGEGRDRIEYENILTPMATYLFFLGCGTYKTFSKEFEYPDKKKFMLELLVPIGSKEEIASKALQVLYDCIMWIYLFTGKEGKEKPEIRKKILDLTRKRDELKDKGIDCSPIRKELSVLNGQIIPGYQYTSKVYREIGMQNSNFGGMENVGNTTITTNRIMPFPEMTDAAFEYMIRVKVHEFYHNLNGSEVTGRSPFEIWLNEAVTVHIEREYHAFLFGEDYQRLQAVIELISPSGVYAQDAGVASMPIEPDGFNNPDELITSITYVKAPEFVRMIETLLGKKDFDISLESYHKKFKHSNASRKDWIECMEETGKIKLQKMAETWLKELHFPIIAAKTEYDIKTKTARITLKQKKDSRWEFPFTCALADENGNDIAQKTKRITPEDSTIIFENVPEPAFYSLNRKVTFFGKLIYEQPQKEMFLQARLDSDIIGRYIATAKIISREIENILKRKGISEEVVDFYFSLLCDEELRERCGGQFFSIFESVEDKRYSDSYTKLYRAKRKFTEAIAKKYKKELLGIYNKCAKRKFTGSYIDVQAASIKNRQVKNICLDILSVLDTPEIHSVIINQFSSATNMTDKINAFRLYVNSSAKDREKVIENYEKIASQNLVSYEAYLSAIGGNDAQGGIELIRKIEKSRNFRIEQSNDQRALFARFALNKKRSLETEEGRALLKEIIIKLAKINEYTISKISPIFGNIDKMEKEYHVPLIELLLDVLKSTSEKETPSVYNTFKRIVLSSTVALGEYEKEFGKIGL